jgi:large subunit ribosomal protein L15
MAAQDILSRLAPAPGARKRRKRIGRGQGSGHGKTSTRGEKGALSRSGSSHRPWFEGGQMPLARRVPKRGFHSPFRVTFQVVNVETLERLAAAGRLPNGVVNPEILARAGAVSKPDAPVKILGAGGLTSRLEVAAHAFSKAAAEKIQAAGGTVHTLSQTAHD